jgi:glycine cleavage system regulatory protein
MHDLVLTLMGPDRPGLVEAVAAVIASHGGNWLESRMTRLSGRFAGILRAELPADKVPSALRALGALEGQGLRVMSEAIPRIDPRAEAEAKRLRLEIVGLDRPGIVREVSQLLANHSVNVEELVTNRVSAPMSGETLFEARADVALPSHGTVTLDTLRAGLERIAADLMVDIKLGEPKRKG